LPLDEAVGGILRAGQDGMNHTHDAFAAYLGHQTPNSGAFKMKLAALRDWGLINRGDPERVEFSPLAVDIVMAGARGGPIDTALIEKAFSSCAAFVTMYEATAKNVLLTPQRIRTTAMMQYKVQADQADKFVEVFARSAVYAGLAEDHGDAIKLLIPGDAGVTADDGAGDVTPDVVIGATDHNRQVFWAKPTQVTAHSPRVVARAIPMVVHNTWSIANGEVEFVIRSTAPLKADAYAVIGAVVTELNKLVDTLGPATADDVEGDES